MKHLIAKILRTILKHIEPENHYDMFVYIHTRNGNRLDIIHSTHDNVNDLQTIENAEVLGYFDNVLPTDTIEFRAVELHFDTSGPFLGNKGSVMVEQVDTLFIDENRMKLIHSFNITR